MVKTSRLFLRIFQQQLLSRERLAFEFNDRTVMRCEDNNNNNNEDKSGRENTESSADLHLYSHHLSRFEGIPG